MPGVCYLARASLASAGVEAAVEALVSGLLLAILLDNFGKTVALGAQLLRCCCCWW